MNQNSKVNINANLNRIFLVDRDDGNVLARINPCMPKLDILFRRMFIRYVTGIDGTDIISKTIFSNVILRLDDTLIFVTRLSIEHFDLHVMLSMKWDGTVNWFSHLGLFMGGLQFESYTISFSMTNPEIIKVVGQFSVDYNVPRLELPEYDPILNLVSIIDEPDTDFFARKSSMDKFVDSLCLANLTGGRYGFEQDIDATEGINLTKQPHYKRIPFLSLIYSINEEIDNTIPGYTHTDDDTMMKFLTNDDWTRHMMEYV